MKSFALLALFGVLSAAVCSVASADVKWKMALQEIHSEEDLEGIEDFLKCAAKCLGETAMAIFKDCNFNMTCWKKAIMGRAGGQAFICAVKCFDLRTRDAALVLLDHKPADNGVITCVAKCIGIGVTQSLEWYRECGWNILCWAKKVGWAAAKCVGSCLISEEIKDAKVAVPDGPPLLTGLVAGTNTEVELPDFLKCLAKCLGKSLADIEQWFNECGNNKKCWAKKVGFTGLKCVGSCIMFDDETSDATSYNAIKLGIVAATNAEVERPYLLKCLAKCLDMSLDEIEELFAKCGRRRQCWWNKVGVEAVKCLRSCIKLDNESSDVTSVEHEIKPVDLVAATNAEVELPYFLKCLAKCLDMPLDKIEQLFKKCGRRRQCWFNKLGVEKGKCLRSCIKLDDESSDVTSVEHEIKPGDANVSEECVAKCLGGSQPDVAQLSRKCYSVIKCWMREVGVKGFLCAASCLSVKEKTPAERYSFSATLTASANKS